MGASTLLQSNEVVVAPGGEAEIVLRVRNTGAVVDQFTFEPLGPASAWMVLDPPQVSLFPGAEEPVRVLFRPPRVSTTPAGTVVWAVRSRSQEDPEGSVVDEGAITVEGFDDRDIELIPRTSRGRQTGRHEVAVDNRGNETILARLVGVDPEDALTFRMAPPEVRVAPGTVHFTAVRVVPRRRFWRGAAQTHPFQLALEQEEREPLVVDGSMLHEPLLPKWFWKAVLAALALLLVLLVLWLTMFKPTIESTATDAVRDDVEQAEEAAVEAEEAAVVAQEAAGIDPATGEPVGEGAAGEEAASADGAGADDGGGAGTAAGSDGPAASGGSLETDFGTPTDFRLVATAVAGAVGTAERAVPAGEAMSLTDVVLQNPNGDAGRLSILRDGDVLWETALENFRDLDFHFVAPYAFSSGQRTVVRVTCDVPGVGPSCSAGASFAGFIRSTA